MNKKIENIFKSNSDEVFIIAEIGKNFIQTEEEKPYSEYLAKYCARFSLCAQT